MTAWDAYNLVFGSTAFIEQDSSCNPSFICYGEHDSGTIKVYQDMFTGGYSDDSAYLENWAIHELGHKFDSLSGNAGGNLAAKYKKEERNYLLDYRNDLWNMNPLKVEGSNEWNTDELFADMFLAWAQNHWTTAQNRQSNIPIARSEINQLIVNFINLK